MKTLKTLLTSVADEYRVSTDEVTNSIRAYFDYLMKDPEFSRAWNEIPKEEGIPAEEFLLALMIAGAS